MCSASKHFPPLLAKSQSSSPSPSTYPVIHSRLSHPSNGQPELQVRVRSAGMPGSRKQERLCWSRERRPFSPMSVRAAPPVQERPVYPAGQDQGKRALTPRPFLLRGLDSAGCMRRNLHRAGGDAVQAAADVGHKPQGADHGRQDSEYAGTVWATPLGRASPYCSSCRRLCVRCTGLSGITFLSLCRCASNSRGVGPAGVGTSASFSMSA